MILIRRLSILGIILSYSIGAAVIAATPATNIVTAVDVVDHAVWNNSPIKIILPVGIERRIDFPVAVKIEWPDDVSANTGNLQLRENGSVYWTAKKAFDTRRVNVFTFTGESYLLDVEAKANASTRTLVILDDRFDNVNKEVAQMAAPSLFDGVDLVRYAAQQLYAPRRLVKPLPGITRVPVSTDDVPLYKSGMLRTCPIAQWKLPGTPSLYVTAVRVTSSSLTPVVLDPRNLRGDWVSATPQHGMVSPAGEEGDTTAWYLVSARPFAEVAP